MNTDLVSAGAAASLTELEAAELHACEQTIQRGLETFLEVGLALATIRDRRLYRAEFATFEEYCSEKWGMTARRARQLWAAAEVVRALDDRNNCSEFYLPATESQARPLTLLPKERQKEAWLEALRTAPAGKISARHVQSVVDRMRGLEGPAPVPERAIPIQTVRVGTREAQLITQTEKVIAETRALLDAIGTADSMSGAEVSNALHRLEKFKDHLARVSDLQTSRGN